MWTYWKCVGDDDEITVVYRTHGDGFGAIDMQVWWPRDRRWHVLPYDNSLRRTIWFGSNSIESATGAEVVGFGADGKLQFQSRRVARVVLYRTGE